MKSGFGEVILWRLEDALQWAESRSIWPLTFGLACCAIEMMGTFASHYDLERYGIFPRATPRQA
ncbi:MAG: NADH-quinone oxidoreductase subunit B, partial [Bacteroidia bacterium]|nr:NADH-quinone oxidoreductase subunit B [Bacteroidia bacterium]